MSVNTVVSSGCLDLHTYSCQDVLCAHINTDESMQNHTTQLLPLLQQTSDSGKLTKESESDEPCTYRHSPVQLFYENDTPNALNHRDASDYYHLTHQRRTPSIERRTGYHIHATESSNNTLLRQAEIREMLVTAERELAEAREECTRRDAEIENLHLALAREQELNHSAQGRHNDAIQLLRSEHAEQTQRLLDQITVLKRLSEDLMEEKTGLIGEAAQRKQQLLALLEREREEKSSIMADYRQQTEALIAEQGREITSLRAVLQSEREQHERLVAEQKDLEEKREKIEEKLLQVEETIKKERDECEKRLREARQSHTKRVEELTAQNAELLRRIDSEEAKQQERLQELEDQVRCAGERMRLQEESHALEHQALKDAYRREVAGLYDELQAAVKQREQLVDQHEKEQQRLLKNEEKLSQYLRQAVEKVRQEKEAVVEEAQQQREELQEKHRAKVAQLQNTIESLRRQLTEESTLRKDVESERDLATVRADGLQAAVNRLAKELEELQVEHRTRERAAGQEWQNNLSQLRTQLRERTEEVEALQREVKQREVEEQRLRDELVGKTQSLQSALTECKQLMSEIQQTADLREREAVEREAALEKSAMMSRAQKTQAEAECQRLQRALEESEGRQQACERQLEDERRALELALLKTQQSRDAMEELTSSLRSAQTRQQEVEEEVRRTRNDLSAATLRVAELEAELEKVNDNATRQAREASQAAKAREAELQLLVQQQLAELTTMRLAVDEMRGELAKASEAGVAKEKELHCMREELNKLHRDSAMQVGSWQDELAESKELYAEDVRRMDEVLYALRADLSRAQAAKAQYQKDLANAKREAERRVSQLEDMLSQMEAAKERLQEDARYREQLNNELQGTVQLLSSRLATQEDDVRRLRDELDDANTKLHNTHTFLGRKDATIGQLTARLRAYEAKGGQTSF